MSVTATATAMAPEKSQLTRVSEASDLSSVPADGSIPVTEVVARQAYAYWEERLKSGMSGSAEEDWYRAERELAER